MRQVLPRDPVRFTYRIVLTISRRSCCIFAIPNPDRRARHCVSIGSNQHPPGIGQIGTVPPPPGRTHRDSIAAPAVDVWDAGIDCP